MLRCEQHLKLGRTTIKVNHQITKFVIGYNKAGKKNDPLLKNESTEIYRSWVKSNKGE